MIKVRRSQERGHVNRGWLDTYHTFSFEDYVDRDYMKFRQMRVLNEDFIQPGQTFPAHSHRDMEILTYVLEGEVEHEDSLGHKTRILPGEIQRMSAGFGITHSERNPSQARAAHLMQIWIYPNAKSLAPSYEQKSFKEMKRQGTFLLIASAQGRFGSVSLHQEADVSVALLNPGEQIFYPIVPGRYAWVQMARGAAKLNEVPLKAGDGAAITEEETLHFIGEEPAEILLFDLP